MKIKYFLVALLGLLLFVAPAQAAIYLDFNIDATHPSGASISYTTAGGPLVGTNISVDSVTGFNTPLNNGSTYFLTNALLSFTTGNFISYTPSVPYVGNIWTFGSGGTITVTDSTKTWLSGNYVGAAVIQSSSGFAVVISSFDDNKDKALTDYYGLFPINSNPIAFKGDMNLSFNLNLLNATDHTFTSAGVLSGDIKNTPQPGTWVPIPPTVWLLGAGLVGLVGLRRKFRK